MSARRYLRQLLGDAAVEQADRVAEWQHRSAEWECADEIRRHAGRRGTAARFVPLIGDELAEAPGPAETAARRDRVEWFLARVAELPPRLRELVGLRLAGRRPAAVADAWGITERRVWQLWRAAVDGIVAGVTYQPQPEPPPVPSYGTDPAELAAVRPLAEVERDAIEAALRATRGDIPHAARLLRIGKATLYRKAKKLREHLTNAPTSATLSA